MNGGAKPPRTEDDTHAERQTNRRRRPNGGFTLLEMIVAVTVLAVVFAVGVPSFNAVSRAQMRTATHRLAGNVKHLFDRAILEKVYIRLVFDLDEGSYIFESTADRFYLRKDPLEVDKEGKIVEPEEEEEEEEEEDSLIDRLFGQDQLEDQQPATGDEIYNPNTTWSGWSEYSKKFKRKKAQFGGYKTELTSKEKLPDGIVFYKIQTAGVEVPVEHGKIYVHIFPHGFVERTVVWLIHADDLELPESEMEIWTVLIEPLSGEAKIFNEKIDFPEPVMDEEGW